MSLRLIYLVGGTVGEYEYRSEWVVDAWTTKALADQRLDVLQGIARKYYDKCREHRESYPDDDVQDPDFKIYDRWTRKQDRINKAARRESGDPHIELDASYYVFHAEVIA